MPNSPVSDLANMWKPPGATRGPQALRLQPCTHKPAARTLQLSLELLALAVQDVALRAGEWTVSRATRCMQEQMRTRQRDAYAPATEWRVWWGRCGTGSRWGARSPGPPMGASTHVAQHRKTELADSTASRPQPPTINMTQWCCRKPRAACTVPALALLPNLSSSSWLPW